MSLSHEDKQFLRAELFMREVTKLDPAMQLMDGKIVTIATAQELIDITKHVKSLIP